MVKSQLVIRIAGQNPHLYASDVETIVNTILDRIAGALAAGGKVELRDFGVFTLRHRQARAGRNPKTGEPVAVEAKLDVQFKPGKAMQARLNC